jgi:hypothetical protein
MWMMIVGVGLLIVGGWMFAVGDDRRPGIRSVRQGVRASRWLLGR